MVKNLPVVWETRVQSLGQKDPLEKEMETHSSILVWRILWTRGAWQATVHGVAKSRTWLSDKHIHFHLGVKVFLSSTNERIVYVLGYS